MIKISVVIVSYKNLSIVTNCLDSIKKFNDIEANLEVIVVDNSPDETIATYLSSNYTWVKTIKSENKGFGAGNNTGVANSNGEILLFLNPDTILIEPIFKFAVRKFESENKLAVFGVKLVDKTMNKNMSYFFIDSYGILSNQIIKLCNKLDIFLKEKMVVSGANIFIRRKDFIDSGMFDEKIFMYYEEMDLMKRVKLLNKEIAYFKDKKIIHLEGKTSTDSINSLNIRLKSLRYYCNKYKLNYEKRLRSEIRYLRIKLTISKYLFKNSNDYEEKMSILDTYLSN